MKTVRKNIGAIIFGIIVILDGLSYAAKNAGYDFSVSSLFFDGWWTLFIIVPGVIKLFEKDSNKIFAVALIGVGAALLCSRLLHVSLWGWVAPAAIAAVGVSIVADAFRGDNGDKGDKNEKKGDGEDDKTDAEIKN